MKYIDDIKQKLSNYKKVKYPELGDGVWKKNKKKYSHIIPEPEKYYNLLSPYREDLSKYIEDNNLKLHVDFHHMNSSQAMCLNFFFPLIIELKLDIILELLNFKKERVNYKTVCFEKEGIEKNYGGQPTSFDFYFETMSNKKIYFEIKYTESDFGKVKKDKKHIDKFDNIYVNFLNPIKKEFHSKDSFFNNYQILRNLIHINKNSFVVFLFPEDNMKIRNEAERAESHIVNNNLRGNFFPLTWEYIFEKVIDNSNNERLKNQLSDFGEKYLTSR